MLNYEVKGTGDQTVFFLHFLAGDTSGWKSTIENMPDEFRCIAIDLPGFGRSAAIPGFSVAEMAVAVVEVIRAQAPREWVLVGHSMGAKVASVVARQAENAGADLDGLKAMVLVAGSPPSPEPIEDKRREDMQTWFAGDKAKNRSQAEMFIDSNTGEGLAATERNALIEAVLRQNRSAWLSWLDVGSREDWSRRVGVLRTPALILAGEKDKDLGPDAQRSLMLPHFVHGRLEVIAGAKHLLPMECPEEVARLIELHMKEPDAHAGRETLMSGELKELIASDRVSSQTRAVLDERGKLDEPAYEPVALTLEDLFVLRAVLARMVPQRDGAVIDIAARMDQQLAGSGDGWRYADLPADAEAYRLALRTLDEEAVSAHGLRFDGLDTDKQDALLHKACEGKLGVGALQQAAIASGLAQPKGGLTAGQMKLWFRDLCGDAAQIYVAHPATLERLGYSGFADGADAMANAGLTQIGMGE